MTTAIFPFQVYRSDEFQGIYGRQIARLIGAHLQDAGLQIERVQWFAHRGDRLTHIAIESPLPANVLREEIIAHGADSAVIGYVEVAGEQAHLRTAVVAPIGPDDEATEIYHQKGPRSTLPAMVQAASAALFTKLTGNAPMTPAQPPTFATWHAQLLQADKNDLESADIS